MKHKIKVVFLDNNTHDFIEHEDLVNGELTLDSLEDEGFIDILLKVSEISIEEKVFRITSRRFSINLRKLFLEVERIN